MSNMKKMNFMVDLTGNHLLRNGSAIFFYVNPIFDVSVWMKEFKIQQSAGGAVPFGEMVSAMDYHAQRFFNHLDVFSEVLCFSSN